MIIIVRLSGNDMRYRQDCVFSVRRRVDRRAAVRQLRDGSRFGVDPLGSAISILIAESQADDGPAVRRPGDLVDAVQAWGKDALLSVMRLLTGPMAPMRER